MKIYSSKSIIFPEGNARGEYDTRGWFKFSYFLNPHAMNALLYRMKPRKHIHVKYYWQTYFKSIGTLSQTFENHIHNNIVTVACKWCVPSDWRFPVKERQLWRENSRGFRRGGIWYLFHGIWFLSCVITCSDFYPLSNQINLFMVINIWGIIIILIMIWL